MPAALSTVSFMELYGTDNAAAPLVTSGTGQSPSRCLLEGLLGDNQDLRSSAFRLGTGNCKAIWQASKSIPNSGLARDVLAKLCSEQMFQTKKIH